MKFRLALSSLFAFGLLPLPSSLAAVPEHTNVEPTPPKGSLFQIFRLKHRYTLAAHGSHSSHGSHGSHRSSSGGGITVPNYRPPVYNPPSPSTVIAPPVTSNSTPPATILPESPATAPKILPGNSDKFYQIAFKVQLALSLYGYYTGTVDGVIGPQTIAALSKFQSEWNLTVTGTITPEVLDAMGIVAE